MNASMGSLGTALNSIIDNAPLPQFLKDAAKDGIANVIGGNQQQTTPEAQDAVNNEYGDAIMCAAQSTAKQACEEADGEEGGNWLAALARGLASVQADFIDKAMANMEIMKDEVSSEDSRLFLKAQSEYQADMQMFNMMANMTATSIKSLGEGLTSIARKQ